MTGLVTMEDVLENIVGEIREESSSSDYLTKGSKS